MKTFEIIRQRISSNRLFLLLLAAAIVTRIGVALLQMTHGIQGIHWLVLIKWNDFYGVYGTELVSLNHGLLPYLNFGYWYPPLFLYVLYIFYLIGGIHLASLPILVADVATAPLVYLLVSTTSAKRVAFIAGLLYALSPVALFVEGYLWLSSQPMTFFLVLSIYLLRKDRPIFSTVALAISILFKQEAIFILPVYTTWYLMKYRTRALKGIVIMLCLVFLISLPFLTLSPIGYLNGVTSGGLGVVYQGPNFIRSTILSTTLSSSTAQSCAPTVPNTFTGSLVTCGLTYSWTKESASFVMISMLDWIASLAIFPLFGLTAILLLLSRKRTNILELSSALAMIGFLLLFSIRVHSLLVYYFIPIYALLFASARGKSTIIILIVTSGFSLFTPDKSYVPALLTLVSISAIVATKDSPNQISIPQIIEVNNSARSS